MSAHDEEGPHGLEPEDPDYMAPGDMPPGGGERVLQGPGDMIMEVLDHMVYDHEVLQAGQKFVHLFANPVGAYTSTLGRNKSREDTNLPVGGCLPMPCQLTVERVDMYFDTPSISVLEAIDYGTLRLRLGPKEYTDIRLAHVPTALFHDPVSEGAAALAKAIMDKSITWQELAIHLLRRRRYVLAAPIAIPPMQAIECKFELPGPLYRDVSIMVALGPRMARPVS